MLYIRLLYDSVCISSVIQLTSIAGNDVPLAHVSAYTHCLRIGICRSPRYSIVLRFIITIQYMAQILHDLPMLLV